MFTGKISYIGHAIRSSCGFDHWFFRYIGFRTIPFQHWISLQIQLKISIFTFHPVFVLYVAFSAV